MGNSEIRTWIEIDKTCLKHNFGVFRKLIGKNCLFAAVVKSNAYGHDLIEASRFFANLGADWLVVDSVIEAYALRKKGLKNSILVLGYVLPTSFVKASNQNISITISSFESLKVIPKNLILKIHLKIDTGMHRQGFFLSDIPSVVKYIKENLPRVKIEGVYSHFAAAKNPSFPQETFEQSKIFDKAVKLLQKDGYSPIRHICASSGTLLYPQFHYDMVRIGISLYGYWPSLEVQAFMKDKVVLRPALSWKSIISEIKTIPTKSMIGYDFTESINKGTKIGIIPVGYWHGFPRSLSSVGRVNVNDHLAKVLGRVCMDMIMADLSSIKSVKIGDEVVILGKNVFMEEFARLSGKSEYEAVTNLNPLIKRLYK